MNKIEIRQIYYDLVSWLQVESRFIPLDNTNGDKSWFEFWPILNFLRNNKLDESTFYGFFSPKFTQKTGLSSEAVIAAIEDNNDKDAVVFSYAWDQLCFFINPWEQGEICHPGITNATQKFLDAANINIAIKDLVTSRKNSVFSNFIVAKKAYWDRWLIMAEKLIEYADNPESELHEMSAPYKMDRQPMKVFIQERLPALILADVELSKATVNPQTEITARFFENSFANKKRLEDCDQIKDEIIEFGISERLIDKFNTFRSRVILENQ